MSEDFSGHPQSITEARVDRSHDARAWTPRDALIRTLRDIDEGRIVPDALVISFRDGGRANFWSASPCALVTLGLLQHTIFKMQE